METNMLRICCRYHAQMAWWRNERDARYWLYFHRMFLSHMERFLPVDDQNGRHLARWYFAKNFIEGLCMLIQISLKFFLWFQSQINQVMAWHRAGDKTLPEPVINQSSPDQLMVVKNYLNLSFVHRKTLSITSVHYISLLFVFDHLHWPFCAISSMMVSVPTDTSDRK